MARPQTSGIFLIGCAANAPYPALQTVNGKMFGDLTALTPPSQRFPAAPTYRTPRLPLADVSGDTSGKEVWSTRLLEAVSSTGLLEAHALPVILRVKGSRKGIEGAGYLVVPTVIAGEWLDPDASDVDLSERTENITHVRRLAVRRDFVAPAPLFILRGLGLSALSPAAARAAAALSLVGTWFEPIEAFTHDRTDWSPPSDGIVGRWDDRAQTETT